MVVNNIKVVDATVVVQISMAVNKTAVVEIIVF